MTIQELLKNTKFAILDDKKHLVSDDSGKVYKYGRVSHKGVFYGYCLIAIADQETPDILEFLVEKHGSNCVATNAIASLLITAQSMSRPTNDAFNFEKAFSMFSAEPDFITAHKDKKSREYLEKRWNETQKNGDSEPRLFVY